MTRFLKAWFGFAGPAPPIRLFFPDWARTELSIDAIDARGRTFMNGCVNSLRKEW